MSENYDLETVVTPVLADELERLLIQTEFDPIRTQFLINGFKHGFSIKYQGPTQVTRSAPNLRLRVGNKIQLWNKVIKEVKNKRFAGAIRKAPFQILHTITNRPDR